jgi:phage baseplate assembly protein W
MPADNYDSGTTTVDPFYPDGYVSTDQDRQQIIAQKEKYAAKVNSINLKFPLRSYRRGFFQGNTDTISAVRENIKTLLLTLKGERVNDANLGTNIPVLQGQLFEPITREETFENIRLEIETAIGRYLPYISIKDIKMVTQEDEPILGNNRIRINMTYVITDQQAMVDNINLTLNNPES